MDDPSQGFRQGIRWVGSTWNVLEEDVPILDPL
jgi:hypothetical protein